MTAPVTLVVHCDVARTSPNERANKWEMTHRRGVMRLAALQALAAAGYPESTVPVRLDILARRATAMDDDNIVAGSKVARDILTNRAKNGKGIVPDDTRKWVRLGKVEQEIAPCWKGREQLCLTVTPIMEEPPP